ncbi:hypothetical protein TMES_07205 [Thalassospira mesophila]|uniref:Uncharacterized protein n=1 Tax=Thalassospira mesophila TaxID=1293891 RepID=A0A1Y2L2M2_9PROT|nr:hypothetical protein TMES_07205 [Thalassospira mesophila]
MRRANQWHVWHVLIIGDPSPSTRGIIQWRFFHHKSGQWPINWPIHPVLAIHRRQIHPVMGPVNNQAALQAGPLPKTAPHFGTAARQQQSSSGPKSAQDKTGDKTA